MFYQIFQNLYWLPLVAAIFLTGYSCLLLAPKKEKFKERVKYNYLDKPFEPNWANDLYVISFQSPFSSFIEENDMHPKAIETNQMIGKAGKSHLLDYRVLTTLQLMLFIVSIAATVLFGILLVNALPFLCLLFNIPTEDVSTPTVFMTVGIIFLLLSIAPKFYIRSKANQTEAAFIKNLPILQIFLVNMIKSNRPIQDILFTLGTANTVYKDIFANAYRIFVRNRVDAYDYLATVFAGTGWATTVNVLRNSDKFDIKDTCTTLVNQITDLEEEVAASKSGKSSLKSLISEGSIGLPLAALMLLGVAPVVIMIMNMLNSASSF